MEPPRILAIGSAEPLRARNQASQADWDDTLDLDRGTAQRVLKEGYRSPANNRIYGYYEGQIYEFRYDNTNGYHGYRCPGSDAPIEYRRTLTDSGRITRAEFDRLAQQSAGQEPPRILVQRPEVAKPGATKDKHHKESGWGSTMDLDDATAQGVLEKGYYVAPKSTSVTMTEHKIYGFNDGKLYEFQHNNTNGYHGYRVMGGEVPPEYRKALRDSEKITRAQYNRLIHEKQQQQSSRYSR